MKKVLFLLPVLLLLASCTASLAQPDEQVDMREEQAEFGDADKQTESGAFDIEFNYRNHLYQYELEAVWRNAEIAKSGISLMASMGTEILLDGTTQLFAEIDADDSKTISREEWTPYQGDFPYDGINGAKDDGINLNEFGVFTAQLNGVDLYPDEHSLSQPANQDFITTLDDEVGAPVSLKILRAGEGGFRAGEGLTFPEGTVFVELSSEFDVHPREAPEFELGPGFLTPLLSMYIEQDYEANNHGALGFSSIVDTNAFNGIFAGRPFTLVYQGEGETGIMDEYSLTITPR